MNKTIAAISTPPGIGGIAVIRISGENAVAVADKVYKGRKLLRDCAANTIHYGFIYDKNQRKIDEALVSIMKAPHSFTAEDVVEISIHGSAVTARQTLSAVISAGAVHAQAGEFTKRAFLNGRIDLSQAEAVIDIINSKNELFGRNALSQLEGGLSDKINKCRDKLVDLAASMQVIIDYPDEDLEDIDNNDIKRISKEVLDEINKLLSSSSNGKLIQSGIKTAIVGKPNAGKSSLMNLLSGTERAIVTDIAGTTRDIIEEYVNLYGVPLRLLDTAGIHETDDTVEKIGVKKSKECIKEADLVIVMLDADAGIDDNDYHILEDTRDKKRIIVINKTDLNTQLDEIKKETEEICAGSPVIEISAKNQAGIDLIAAEIKKLYELGETQAADMLYITNARHQTALENSAAALKRVIGAIDSGMPSDIASIDLNIAIDALGEITGATVSEDIVNEIFHRFCVGK